MCEHPIYAAVLRDEFDLKFKRTGIRSQMRILGSVSKIKPSDLYLQFPKEKYIVFMKECGKCLTCRFKQSAQKAAQVDCETKLHKDNCFITLTFGDKELYNYFRHVKKYSYYMAKKYTNMLQWSLDTKMFQLFMKRLRINHSREFYRKYLFDNNLIHVLYKYDKEGEIVYDSSNNPVLLSSPEYAVKKYNERNGTNIILPDCPTIKVMHCGEYGSDVNTSRPHHHAILMNYSPKDIYKESYYKQGRKSIRKRSRDIDRAWNFGITAVDECNYNTINYVSRYVTKKIIGKAADVYYDGKKPEYCTQSTRSGGLGKDYFLKYFDMFKNRKCVTVKTKTGFRDISLPRYFRELWKRHDYDSYCEFVRDNMSDISNNMDKFINDDRYRSEHIVEFNAQGVKSLSTFRRLIRSFERDLSGNVDSYYAKAQAFGISPELLDKHRDVYQKYLSSKSYKNFKQKFKNEDLHNKFIDFEKYRKRTITKYKAVGFDNVVYMYERLRNPYRIKGYTSCLNTPMAREYIPDSIFSVGEALYA